MIAGDIGVRSLQDWAEGSPAAAGPGCRVTALPTRCSTTCFTRIDPERAHRAGLPGGAGGAAGARPARLPQRRSTPVQRDGADLPQRARAGGRLRQERRRHRRAGRARLRPRRGRHRHRRAAARQPDSPGCSGCTADRAVVNRMGFNNDGAEVGRAPARRTARVERSAPPATPGARASTSARPRWCPRTTRRRCWRTTRRAPGCSRRTPTTWSSTSPRPTRPACARLQAVERLEPLLRAVRRRADQVTGDAAGAAAGQDRARPRRRGRAGRGRPGPRHRPRRRSSPPTPRSAATACSAPRPRSRRPAPAGSPARRCASGRWRCCGCCAGRVGDDLTLIGVGGITTVEDARARLDAGADAGPGLHRRSSTRGRCGRGGSADCVPTAGDDPGGDHPMTTFGARLRAAIDERGPLCAGIDPHSALLARVGARRRRGRAGAVRPDRRRGAGAVRRGGQAADRVLRAVRQPRRRGPRAGHRRVPGGRRAGAPRREARRHRLDQPGLRRRLPRPGLAAGLGRDHREPLPRLRLARPVRRDRAHATTPACSCSR